MTGAITALLLVVVWGGRMYPLSSLPILGLAGGGALLFAAFLVIEARVPGPIVPLRLFRLRAVSVTLATTTLTGALVFGVMVYVPLWAQGALGASATRAGALLIPFDVFWALAAMASGRIVARTGRYRVFPVLGTACFVTGFLLLSRIDEGTDYLTVLCIMVVLGLGGGLSVPLLLIGIQNAVATRAKVPSRRGAGHQAWARLGRRRQSHNASR